MGEKKVFKIVIWLAVMMVILEGIVQIWNLFRMKQEFFLWGTAEYQAAAENDEREISDGHGIYISDERQELTATGEVDISSESREFTAAGEDYISEETQEPTATGEIDISSESREFTAAGEDYISEEAQEPTAAEEIDISEESREFTDVDEINISDEPREITDAEEIDISDETQTISDGNEVYINSISGHRKVLSSSAGQDTDGNAVYISKNVDEDSEQRLIQEKEVYINEKTSYRILIEDDAQLLEEEEKQKLAASMREITEYGNVAFKTIDRNDWNTESYARQYYSEQFGTSSGTLFLIDMDNRNIWIHSDGAVYKVITKAYANTITDNVYRYASGGDYYDCAKQTYDQILALLKGNKIAQPMKYISNGLLAVILALLLNYGLVSLFARKKKPRRKELLGNARNHFSYTQPRAFFRRESRTYNPRSSGGSSSGGSSSGGGGGSSGGSSGGGGGHSF